MGVPPERISHNYGGQLDILKIKLGIESCGNQMMLLLYVSIR
jgi:hypothetical protein